MRRLLNKLTFWKFTLMRRFNLGDYSKFYRIRSNLRIFLERRAENIEVFGICKLVYRFGTLHIYSTRPGLVIGRQGSLLAGIKKDLNTWIGEPIKVKVHSWEVW